MKTLEKIALLYRFAAPVITAAFVALLIATCQVAYAAPASQELVQRDAYFARAGDCIACHSARGGKPFAGGLPLATPIGTVYSTNITPTWKPGSDATAWTIS